MGRVYDGILGLCVADALGVPVEFMSREEIGKNPVIGMREFGTHNQPMGTWSDDSSLNLALTDSLVRCGGLDYEDIMKRFTDWYMYGEYTAGGEVFDVGNSTAKALMSFAHGTEPRACGGRSEYENGNGSLMRILPVSFYLLSRFGIGCEHIDEQLEIVHDVSRLTHGHAHSLIACGIYVMTAMELTACGEGNLEGAVKRGISAAERYYEAKDEYREPVKKYKRMFDLNQFKRLNPDQIRSSGYVVDTLEAAVWCLLTTGSYRECVLKAVNLGDDTDTVAAVAGGLAGLAYGEKSIPPEWKARLLKAEYIRELCHNMEEKYKLSHL